MKRRGHYHPACNVSPHEWLMYFMCCAAGEGFAAMLSVAEPLGVVGIAIINLKSEEGQDGF